MSPPITVSDLFPIASMLSLIILALLLAGYFLGRKVKKISKIKKHISAAHFVFLLITASYLIIRGTPIFLSLLLMDIAAYVVFPKFRNLAIFAFSALLGYGFFGILFLGLKYTTIASFSAYFFITGILFSQEKHGLRDTILAGILFGIVLLFTPEIFSLRLPRIAIRFV